MAEIYNESGGGTVWSSDLTATAGNVMVGYIAITNDSNDEPIMGTLPLTHILPESGGTLSINSISDFNAVQSTTTYQAVAFTWNISDIPGKPWGGVYVRAKLGSTPVDRNDGIEFGYHPGRTGGTQQFTELTSSGHWYFRAWDFYRYNQTGSSTVHDEIFFGDYHDSDCDVVYYAKPVYITSSTMWTVPKGLHSLKVCCVGGGGGGGGSDKNYVYGAGGGGGGYVVIDNNVSVNPEDTIAVTIGNGGTAGASTWGSGGGTGNTGGTTSFGTLVSASGGTGGVYKGSGGSGGCSGGGTNVSDDIAPYWARSGSWAQAKGASDGGRSDYNDRYGYARVYSINGKWSSGEYNATLVQSGTSGSRQDATVSFLGVNYSGGGGGGARDGRFNGLDTSVYGGTGYQGGGNGATNGGNATAGTANTGGGGGGASGQYYGTAQDAANGGSGIVIIDWEV